MILACILMFVVERFYYQWYLYNGHANVISFTNDAGTVKRTYKYNVFGNKVNPKSFVICILCEEISLLMSLLIHGKRMKFCPDQKILKEFF